MTPDWTGNPQHVIAGVVLAFVLTLVARRWAVPWIAMVLGISLTFTAECAVEVLEWRVLLRDTTKVSAYYDTIADLTVTGVGAIVGGLLAAVVLAVRSRRARPIVRR